MIKRSHNLLYREIGDLLNGMIGYNRKRERKGKGFFLKHL